MLIGLIAVGSIATVARTGSDVSQIYCAASSAIKEAVTGEPALCNITAAAPGDTEAAPGEDPAPGGPDAAQPGFTDITFDAGTKGDQFVLVRPEPVFRQTHRLTAFTAGGGIKPCVVLKEGDLPTCDVNTITVPASVHAYGYMATLPLDEKSEWTRQVSITLNKQADGSEVGHWSITASRVAVPYQFEPGTEMGFADVHYPAGSTGWQSPQMTTITGQYNDALELHFENGTSFSHYPYNGWDLCLQASAGAAVECGPPPTNSGQRAIPSGTHAFGYRVFLPTNDKLAVSDKLGITFRMTGDRSKSVKWTPQVTRDAVPADFEPTANVVFNDVVYPAGATGWQAPVMTKLEGSFNASLILKLDGATTFKHYPYTNWDMCIQDTAASAVVCAKQPGNTNEKSISKSTYAIGYRLMLDSDDKNAISDTLRISLMLSTDRTKMSVWTPKVTRDAVAYQFQPDAGMQFNDVVYPAGATGWQEPVMTRYSGQFNDSVQLVFGSGTTFTHYPYTNWDMCTQATAESAIVCAKQPSNTNVKTIAASTYAIGYRLMLNSDDKQAISDRLTITLRLARDTSQSVVWKPSITRAAVPYQFAPSASMDFPSTVYPAGSTGWQAPQMTRYDVVANDTVLLIFGSGTTFKHYPYAGWDMCIQATEGGAIECAKQPTNTNQRAISPSTYAIGYRLNMPTNKATTVTDKLTITLRLSRDASQSIVWRPDISRPAE